MQQRSADASDPLGRVTWRAVAIGFALIPLEAWWLVTVEMVRGYHYPTCISLFFHAVFTLVVLSLLNAPLRRWVPRLALSPAEVATVYTIVCLGSATSGIDWAGLTAVMTYPARFASPENRWAELMHPLLPRELMVFDEHAVKSFWAGSARLYEPAGYGPWLAPLARWMVFGLLLAVGFLACTALFRKRWLEVERLSYPVAQLPMAIVAAPERLLRSQPFWCAMVLVVFADSLNGLHVLWPAVPQIPLRSEAAPGFQIGGQITDPPWNAIGFLSLAFYPFVIGLGMLIPAELCFSCVVFYLGFKAQAVLARHLGLLTGGFPFPREQSLGAYLGLAVFSLWMGRRQLAESLREALGRSRRAADGALSARTVLLLGLCAFGGIVVFAARAGMAPWYSVAWFGAYFLLSLSFSRIRAEMGLPSHEMHYAGPGQVLPRLLGTRLCGARNMASTYAFYWFNYGQRCHPAPHIAEGHRIAERVRLSSGSLAVPMVGAMLIGLACCSWLTLHQFYRYGASQAWTGHQSMWIPGYPATELATNLTQQTGPNLTVAAALGTGFVAAIAGIAGYARIGGWPLHPVGYAVSSAWAMEHMWFALLVAWAVKSLLSRYGGAPSQRKAAPFAMGLILGDFLAGSIWSLYGMLLKKPPYSIFP